MNALKLKTWSERQQVLAVILMAGAAIFALWFFLLIPLNRQRRRLERDIESMRSQLASKNYLLGEDVLDSKRKDEERYNRELVREWASTTARIAAFPNPVDVPASDIRHIDFKVALFDMRSRLLQKSKAMKITLPRDLGIDDAVDSDTDARKLMLQLRTIERVVDMALDLRITMLKRIMPQPAVLHAAGDKQQAFLEEYPVEMEFCGTLQNLYDFFRATLEPEQVLVLRNLRVEAARGQPGLLSVRARLGALVFLSSPDRIEMAPAGNPGVGVRSAPMGH